MPNQLAPKVLNWASILDDQTRDQAIALSKLPFIAPHISLMPDAHFGKGSSVGTVIPTRGAVIPAAVGVDIGCGMSAVRTSLTEADINEHIEKTGKGLDVLLEAIIKAIPMSAGNYNGKLDRFTFTEARLEGLETKAANDEVDLAHSPKWREQLGSLGGGNHFIELCIDEEGHVWLFLHSGSRGVGNKIAQRHIKIAQTLCDKWFVQLEDRDHAYLPHGTDEFWRYIKDLHWAQDFAYANRGEMLDRFRQVFGEWMDVDPDEIETERIQTHHNYTQQTEINGQKVWLTRKGAIDASLGVRGLIPGSMGTRSYVVTGKGSVAGLFSAPHGAGRLFSRNEARKRFTEADLEQAMGDIVYRKGEAWIDEIPGAYKDIDQIMEDASDLVTIDHTLRQILNTKGE